MLFNSYIYFALFLPVTVLIFFLLNRFRLTIAAKGWLVLCSLFFYSWWDVAYLPLILFSILFNYSVGTALGKHIVFKQKRLMLIIGVLVDISLLGYYKYSDFFLENINQILSVQMNKLHLILPLAISFFTFQQIAYLYDSYKGETREYNFLNYMLFIAFFPQLIAGPIVHHREMMPQFSRKRNALLSYKNLSIGLYIFVFGLAKKILIADMLSPVVGAAFDHLNNLSFADAWIASLSYTFQIYFDFSGYMDMALGSALMLNIHLPINFDSPYKSLSVSEFWRRWHITLGRFLKDHIYIPLGGNRGRRSRVFLNILIVFLVGGLWHGAAWTFLIWGGLHGLAVVMNRLWSKHGIPLNNWIAWITTFLFINISWVFFRAPGWDHAINVLSSMLGFTVKDLPFSITILKQSLFSPTGIVLALGGLVYLTVFMNNTHEIRRSYNPGFATAMVACILGILCLVNMDRISEFLYFNF